MTDPLADALISYEALTSRARTIDHTLQAAAAMRAGAIRDAGTLMVDRAVHNETHPGHKLDVTEVASLTTLSRPTVYQARDDHDPEQSSAALARLALGYGLGTGHGSESELVARYPWLGGWQDAIQWLGYDGPLAAWEAAHPGEEMDDDTIEAGLPHLPGYTDLHKRYRQLIEEIAGGA